MNTNEQNNSDGVLPYFIAKFEDAIKHKNTKSAVRRAKQISLLLDASIIYMLVANNRTL